MRPRLSSAEVKSLTMQIGQKVSETPRAQSRGWVWRKGLAKVRADEQEPDMRRDVSRDELARDNEVSYLSRERFVNQASYARKVLKLIMGDLLGMSREMACHRVTEGRENRP